MSRSRLTIAAAFLALAVLAGCDTHKGEHCDAGYTTSQHTTCKKSTGSTSSTKLRCTTTGGDYVCTHWAPDNPATVKPEDVDQ